jgi:hypothetical protein
MVGAAQALVADIASPARKTGTLQAWIFTQTSNRQKAAALFASCEPRFR